MTADLIPPGAPEFVDKFVQYRYSVFRLETLQNYGNSGEEEAFVAWRAGQSISVTPELRAWTQMIRANAQAGRIMQRVHVVTEPLSDYIQFELAGYAPNVEAGEDIRIIPVRERGHWPMDVPQHDYWLFDSHELYDQNYDADGWWLGTERIRDPERIVDACRWRDAALHQAMPWKDYVDGQPVLAQQIPSES
ncbi:MAG: hypothetical protein GEU83_11525 [Pseudonocardiaceae bacterium]|nr:hypothetical protein [Pseudonocardiaceae bacterium]